MRNINDALSRINQLTTFPEHYQKYNKLIFKELYTLYSLASNARSKGLDPSLNIETDIAFDLSDRVERMFNIPLADRLRELLSKYRTENAASVPPAERIGPAKLIAI
jgi:hypothetical protein